ncbi:MAG: hypothetical protein HY344_01880 [Candidatus Levybacteria bacterium]|nr:hypothetical protein [Candidatus Levybacteria bacterium]
MIQNRKLIVIPIVHTKADFGQLGQRMNIDAEMQDMVRRYWNGVFDFVKSLPVDFSSLRVYQDGLPDTGDDDVSLVVERAQTPNYEVIRWLRDKGAHIVGTEDKDLLVRQYNLLQAVLTTDPIEDEDGYINARLEYRNETPILSQQRNVYITQRIKDTLPEGGTGILFIGLAHEVKKMLEKDMNIVEPPETLLGSSTEFLQRKIHAERS